MPQAQVLPFPLTGAGNPSVGSQPRVPRVSWASHLAWLDENVWPGEHTSIIDPTGNGKTYLATRGLLANLWRDQDVLIIDTKGDDETLMGVGHKVRAFPLWFERAGRKLPWYRIVIPTTLAGVSRVQQRLAVDAVLRKAFKKRGLVVLVDELKTLVRLGMQPQIEDFYERGRRKKPKKALTFIGLSQAPSWMPSCVYTQPRHLYLGKILDTAHRKRLAEIGGNSKVLQAALNDLRDHEFVYIGDKGRRMEIIKVGR